MKLLDPATLRFQEKTSGGLRLFVLKGCAFETIHCTQLFPVSDPDRYISIQAQSGGESMEIGILPDIRDLTPDQQRLVKTDIRYKYFVPEILDILKIEKKRGKETWRVVTDRGEKTFGIIDKHETILVTEKGVIFITDIDRFRYKISNPAALPQKALTLLEKNLL